MKLDLRSAYLSVLSAVVLLSAAACVKTDNDADEPPVPPGEGTLASITITPASTKVGIGAKQKFIATGSYTDGSTKAITEEVVWAVADTAVATISNEPGTQGELTGVAVGTTSVTATSTPADSSPAIVGTTSVEVVTATLSSLELKINSTYGRTPVGFTTHLSAIGHYSDTTTADLTSSVTWIGLTPDIAMVSDVSDTKGYLTGIKAGSGRVTATLDTITQQAIVAISNETLINISMTPSSANLPANAKQQFSCRGNFSGGGYDFGEQVDLTVHTNWASSDTSIVTVSNEPGSKGLATGVSGFFPGSANVTATYGAGDTTVVGTARVTRPLF